MEKKSKRNFLKNDLTLLQKRKYSLYFLTVIIGFAFTFCNPVPSKERWQERAERLYASGEYKKFFALTDLVLKAGNLTPSEIQMIDSLKEISKRICLDFSLSESQIHSQLVKYYPKLDSGQISNWEKNLKLEMRLIDGQKRYFNHAVSNLFRIDNEARKRKTAVDGSQVDALGLFCIGHTRKIIAETKISGKPVMPVKMKLNYIITVKPNVVPDGKTIRCWMPFPREGNARQKKIRLLKSDPGQSSIAPESDLQRTVYLEKNSVKDQPTLFNIEFEVESSAQYFDLKPEIIRPYDTTGNVYREFTAERAPQIVFTKEIKQLADRIISGETNPLLQAQKIYNWINDSVRWASALEYSVIPDIPGYVLNTRHGDCGMQTLLFMTLARSLGIPVKWQSGWMLHPGEVNLHDWCEVYFEGIGWVPVDQSFGLQDDTDERVRNFYRSGIDAYRLIVNDDYGRKLTPAKKYMRSEPYDFQRGELEWEGGNLYFDQWNWQMKVEYE
jgi:hypothetical protein